MVSRGSMKHAAEYHFSDSFKLFEEGEMREPKARSNLCVSADRYHLKLDTPKKYVQFKSFQILPASSLNTQLF